MTENKLPLLTVFTPTYNRAYTLNQCYESLKRQSSKEFIWLIIDDGSSDGTKELVEKWICDNDIQIQYDYQENQGMHGAHNRAYELISTELNVCIDSDDYLPDQAVEKINHFWRENGCEEYAGIVGLDASKGGQIIGTRLPKFLNDSTLTDLYSKHKMKGDKKLVYRTELMKQIPPYPIFEGEKYCPLSYKYIMADQICPLLILDEVLCIVEYLEDGSSLNMIHQYKKNPRGFSFFRKKAMEFAPNFKDKLRESIHYVSSNLLMKNKRYLLESPCKMTTVIASPAGLVLYLFLIKTKKATIVKK
ncbi:glycosyltransferase family 2 protein [Alkalihalobacillus trypoxylicola]|uniref:Glycosyltransferase n=1 Tax=Alkalihalobacillus trypoxylicola TaxID=519424 RepID=A0A161PG40_9BACI|nr:glycosyltransferase family 2 protein [Alkalihalobacillus trypoxylicola]KYG27662.1 glycosyltransferase [Alkalihalobacillus trypoxylicola]